MGKQDEIRAALKRHAAAHGPAPTLLAIVVSVDEAALTCVLKDDDGIEVPGVRLAPVEDGNFCATLLPKVNTWALAVRIESDEEYMLLAAGEADKIIHKVGSATLTQTAAGFEIKKGSDSLKDILKNITEATQQIVVMYGNNPDYTKLAAALTKINNLFV